MRMRHIVGMFLIGSIALVGCGSDDKDDAAATATTVAGATTATTTATGGSVTQAKCVEAATAMSQAATDIPLALSSGTTAGLAGSVDAFKNFADSAPSEIRSDLKTIADGFSDFVKVLVDANISPASGQAPSAETSAKIQAAAEKLSTSDFTAASTRVTAWFTDKCGK
jgi:hypothetical protein